MLKFRFSLLFIICIYFLIFAVQNNMKVNVILPFLKSFNVPLFVVIIASLVLGMTLQWLTTGLRRK